jgi:hypothetical protein
MLWSRSNCTCRFFSPTIDQSPSCSWGFATSVKCVCQIQVIALRPQTPKHLRGGWSHYTDTSEAFHGNGVQNMVTVPSGFEPANFQSLTHELTNCSNRVHQTQIQMDDHSPWCAEVSWNRSHSLHGFLYFYFLIFILIIPFFADVASTWTLHWH